MPTTARLAAAATARLERRSGGTEGPAGRANPVAAIGPAGAKRAVVAVDSGIATAGLAAVLGSPARRAAAAIAAPVGYLLAGSLAKAVITTSRAAAGTSAGNVGGSS
jgi:hypothetical protein